MSDDTFRVQGQVVESTAPYLEVTLVGASSDGSLHFDGDESFSLSADEFVSEREINRILAASEYDSTDPLWDTLDSLAPIENRLLHDAATAIMRVIAGE